MTSPASLGDLFDEPALGLSAVDGPVDRARQVRWAHCTELVDPVLYLRGGELVLTVGSALRDAESCASFAAALARAGATALALGLGDCHNEVPPALREACRSRGLPLLTLPHGVPFMMVTELLAERRTQAALREADFRRREQDLGHLIGLAVEGIAAPRALLGSVPGASLPVRLAATAWDAAGWEAGARNAVQAAAPDGVCAALGDDVIVLVGDVEPLHALAVDTGAACGLGDPGGIEYLVRSVEQARQSLALSRVRGVVVRAQDLTTLEALFDLVPERALRPFVDELITPLTAHDGAHSPGLLATLRAFLDGDGAVVATARSLYLHPNTLRHRLGRIADITGRNPVNIADRMAFVLAVWAHDRGVRLR